MPARPLNSVSILGTGLIGGSIGLALRARRPDLDVVGYDDETVSARAGASGAVTRTAASVAEAVADADLVVIAAPLAASMHVLRELAPHVRAGAIVTDVGSVKSPIVEHASRVLPGHATFVGGHPMAGSERGGIEHADALLFENAVWALCPAGDTAETEQAFRARCAALVEMVEATGARALLIEAERHDRVAAAISHLPQLLSVALVNEALGADEAARTLAASGFRDMTRIASSPFGIWREILTANQGAVLDVLARFTDRLTRLRYAVAAEDWDALEDAFVDAHRQRASVPERTKGFLRPLAEVVAYTEDRPGTLLALVGAITETGVDIRDAELLNVREGVEGVFRFALSTDEEAERVVQALETKGFRARRR